MSERVYVQGTPRERFLAHLEWSGDCLVWRASCDSKGYGRFNAGTGRYPRFLLAHRFAAELAGMDLSLPIMHTCDNPPCCNIAHLVPGTIAENNADMRSKGRHVHGERVWSARLTAAQARRIHQERDAGSPVTEIAQRYGVAARTVYDVLQGRTWVRPCREVTIDGKPVIS